MVGGGGDGLGSRLSDRSDLREFDGRIRTLILLFSCISLLLLFRLWQLQVLGYDYYSSVATQNFIRSIDLVPERGRILDIEGRVLADNRPSWNVHLTPQLSRTDPELLDRLQRVLALSDESAERLRRRIQSARADLLVRRDISRDQLATLETMKAELPGVYVQVSHRRTYPYHELFAHTVGYMNEINESELARLSERGYQPGEYIGRAGVERSWESVLRGSPGVERQVVDVLGRSQPEYRADELIGTYRRVQPLPGRDIVLSINARVQDIAEEAASAALSAAIVVVDPRDGSVMALHSRPSFNPNAWSGRLSELEKRLSDNNPFHPMLDKTMLSWFPGSTWKVVTAIAALEEHATTSEEEIDCPGFFEYGNRVFRCWKRSGHGKMNLREALRESCDVFFYQVALRMGLDRLAGYAYDLGFGERTGLGINGESPGVVPTREWHEANSPGGFQHGFTVNSSVGQGDTRTSPLQMAMAYAAMATGGRLHYPRFLHEIRSDRGELLFYYPPRLRRQLTFEEEYVDLIRDGLVDVLHDPAGTAYDYRLGYVDVAGKTGTAQVRALDTVRLDGDEIYFRDRDHAWFVAWAPAEDPEVVVSVFVEHGGAGSATAAPIAMRVIDRYLREIRGYNDEIELWSATSRRRRGPLPWELASGQLDELERLWPSRRLEFQTGGELAEGSDGASAEEAE